MTSLANLLTHGTDALLATTAPNLANGTTEFNTAMPTSSHITPGANWVLKEDTYGNIGPAGLEESICEMAKVHLSVANRNNAADVIDIQSAVILSLGRLALWRYMNLTANDLKGSEVTVIASNATAKTVDAAHEAAVRAAFNEWQGMATRLMAVAWYNAISFETANHHHLPSQTKKLATTTTTLLGMKAAFDLVTDMETLVMHDMFHMLSFAKKAAMARNVRWAETLTGLGFDNLRKRVPVKASDSALALNYPVLLRKAKTYPHEAVDLPPTLSVPARLTALETAYRNATTEDEVRTAVGQLRAMGPHLEHPSSYIVGFVLAQIRKENSEDDLDVKTAGKNVTILGSPAYRRITQEHSGVFHLGLMAGSRRASSAANAEAKKQMWANVHDGMKLAVHSADVFLAVKGGQTAPAAPASSAGMSAWFAPATATVARIP